MRKSVKHRPCQNLSIRRSRVTAPSRLATAQAEGSDTSLHHELSLRPPRDLGQTPDAMENAQLDRGGWAVARGLIVDGFGARRARGWNQVTRLIPIAASEMNDRFVALLQSSPFRFYRLVDTQGRLNVRAPDGSENDRPCNPNLTFPIPPARDGCYTQFPMHLRYTSMETYMATYGRTTEQTSSDSCMNCHGAAGLDFSYIWLDAKTEIVPITP
jgi:hypothetical protein